MSIRRILVILSIISITTSAAVPMMTHSAHAASVQRVTDAHMVRKASHNVTVKWDEVPGAQKYQVLVMNKAGKHVRRETITNDHKLTVKKLQPDTSYRFRVRAKAGNKWGKYSKIVRVRTDADTKSVTAVVPQVQNVRIVRKAYRNVTVKWDEVPGAQKYQVLLMDKDGKQLRKETVVGVDKLTVKQLEPDTAYRLRVRAKVGTWGKYSSIVRVRTEASPADEVTEPTQPEDTVSEEEEEVVETPVEEPIETPVEEPAPSHDILVGFWGLNGYLSDSGLEDVKSRFNSDIFQVASASPTYAVNTLLPMAREHGMKVTLRMSGSHSRYTTNGNFDLAKWKQEMSVWENSGVQEFIDDGTLVGHMVLDDISNFAGYDPNAADLDEMARYSKQIMPGLMTFVRVQATKLPVPNDGTYDYLDSVVNQYKASEGDVYAYAEREYNKAKSMNLDVINGLNICDGGDGSSGQDGWRSGKYAMTADEISRYSEALLAVPGLKMFLMWEYDGQERWSDGTIGSDYFDQPDLQSALAEVGLN